MESESEHRNDHNPVTLPGCFAAQVLVHRHSVSVRSNTEGVREHEINDGQRHRDFGYTATPMMTTHGSVHLETVLPPHHSQSDGWVNGRSRGKREKETSVTLIRIPLPNHDIFVDPTGQRSPDDRSGTTVAYCGP